MQDLSQHPRAHMAKRKKSPDYSHTAAATTYKSPYFASVRRNSNNSKHRITAQPQNALHITKYSAAHDQSHDNKKVFKRFNRFQQIDYMYADAYGEKELPKDKNKQDKLTLKTTTDRENELQQQSLQNREHKISSNPKAVLYSSKTLALAQKYSSYKSIIMSTPKMIKQSKEKPKRNSNFRTKTKSGYTIHWGAQNSEGRLESSAIEKQENPPEQKDLNEDWLCKELIKNQVYGDYDDDWF